MTSKISFVLTTCGGAYAQASARNVATAVHALEMQDSIPESL
jgi:hypothetical protein